MVAKIKPAIWVHSKATWALPHIFQAANHHGSQHLNSIKASSVAHHLAVTTAHQARDHQMAMAMDQVAFHNSVFPLAHQDLLDMAHLAHLAHMALLAMVHLHHLDLVHRDLQATIHLDHLDHYHHHHLQIKSAGLHLPAGHQTLV